ncbi:MAG: hypothetical protein ACRC1R_00675 [Cetobacterium sp.]|uniref:hypothetical protein n=1 Tax=Cetobacterium sp. TaxID=2071632 RepID=UPI003F419C5D
MIKKIDLEKFLTPGGDYLSGRPEGEGARKNENLDEFDLKEDNSIELLISDKIIGVNISFFLGLLSISLKPFQTREEILKKVKLVFTGSDLEIRELVNEDFEYMIKKILDKRDINDILK